ncbi:hypothetical protein YC2023_011662 [Brassica napus]
MFINTESFWGQLPPLHSATACEGLYIKITIVRIEGYHLVGTQISSNTRFAVFDFTFKFVEVCVCFLIAGFDSDCDVDPDPSFREIMKDVEIFGNTVLSVLTLVLHTSRTAFGWLPQSPVAFPCPCSNLNPSPATCVISLLKLIMNQGEKKSGDDEIFGDYFNDGGLRRIKSNQ